MLTKTKTKFSSGPPKYTSDFIFLRNTHLIVQELSPGRVFDRKKTHIQYITTGCVLVGLKRNVKKRFIPLPPKSNYLPKISFSLTTNIKILFLSKKHVSSKTNKKKEQVFKFFRKFWFIRSG